MIQFTALIWRYISRLRQRLFLKFNNLFWSLASDLESFPAVTLFSIRFFLRSKHRTSGRFLIAVRAFRSSVVIFIGALSCFENQTAHKSILSTGCQQDAYNSTQASEYDLPKTRAYLSGHSGYCEKSWHSSLKLLRTGICHCA